VGRGAHAPEADDDAPHAREQDQRDCRDSTAQKPRATLAAIALHALALLGDSYFHPSLADLTIPFVSGYREPYMALGIIAGWGFALFGLSYYLRKRIGTARWKVIHRFTALAWILGVIHSLGEGTDARATWFLIIVACAVLPSLALLIARLAKPRGSRLPAKLAGGA
jgi:sulfoxide reductase heme-binding subunit YedZ